MLKSEVIKSVEANLERHGMPAFRIERISHELRDHWEDLKEAARQSGLNDEEVARKADHLLGDADAISRATIDALGQSSWFGRHPTFSICILPLLLVPMLMSIVVVPTIVMAEVGGPYAEKIFGGNNAYYIAATINWMHSFSVGLTSIWLCWRVWMAGLGKKWILAVCSWCALMALVRYFYADAGGKNVTLSASFPWPFGIRTMAILSWHLLLAILFTRSKLSIPFLSGQKEQKLPV